MKQAVVALLLIIACLRIDAQIESFGEFGLSLGTSRFLHNSLSGLHPAGTMHCMAGLQFGKLALHAGLGFIVLSDKRPDFYFSGTETAQSADLDFPIGATVRFSFDKIILAAGADVSGFIGRSTLMIAPHVDLLFAGRRGYRGIFIKGFTPIERGNPGFRPQYFGIGFKTTFG